MGKKTTKRLSGKGSLTIPSNLRAKYGYLDKGFVSIVENEDGSLVIKPTQRGCFFCEEPTEILYMGTPICKECAEKISKLLPEEIKAANTKKSTTKKSASKKTIEGESPTKKASTRKQAVYNPSTGEMSLELSKKEKTKKEKPAKRQACYDPNTGKMFLK